MQKPSFPYLFFGYFWSEAEIIIGFHPFWVSVKFGMHAGIMKLKSLCQFCWTNTGSINFCLTFGNLSHFILTNFWILALVSVTIKKYKLMNTIEVNFLWTREDL